MGGASATPPPLAEELGREIAVEIAGGRRTPAKKDATTHARHPRHAAHLSRPAVRRRGHRRIGKDDAARPAGEVADGQRPSGVRHRMELVSARQGGDQGRQEEERPDADDVQPAARDRLRGPAAVQDHPAAQGRHDRARRSLRLHGVRARRRARRRSPVGARPLQLRRASGPGGVLPRADRRLAGPAARPPREAEVLRGRHGHGLERERRPRASESSSPRCSRSTIGSCPSTDSRSSTHGAASPNSSGSSASWSPHTCEQQPRHERRTGTATSARTAA